MDAVDWNLVPGSSAALAPADGPGAALISQKVRQIMLSGDGGIQISFGNWDRYYIVLEPGNEPGGRALRGGLRAAHASADRATPECARAPRLPLAPALLAATLVPLLPVALLVLFNASELSNKNKN